MHPTLAKILATWRLSHWSRLYGRQPTHDDLVVPTRNLTPIHSSDAAHAFKADLEALGLRVDAGERCDRGGSAAPRTHRRTTSMQAASGSPGQRICRGVSKLRVGIPRR